MEIGWGMEMEGHEYLGGGRGGRKYLINIYKLRLISIFQALKRFGFYNMIHYYFSFCHVKFNPPIPIRAWEVNLSENWLKGICDHAPDDDHMGSERL